MNRQNYLIVQALLQSSNTGKQKFGQRIAACLGFIPGPRGRDDGIDGHINNNGVYIHFQSKLRSVPLDVDDAKTYYSDLVYHRANISIILSGVGFKSTFVERLYGHNDINRIRIHLLELNDIFDNSLAFKQACLDLPTLKYLDEKLKDDYGLN